MRTQAVWGEVGEHQVLHQIPVVDVPVGRGLVDRLSATVAAAVSEHRFCELGQWQLVAV